MSETTDLARELISRQSITPDDSGCQDVLVQRLKKIGFTTEILQFNQVTNCWAHHGTDAPLFVFAGHTDVVPPGPLDQWTSPPFTPTERNGKLYGRGAADMKSSVAAMVIASEQFVKKHPDHRGKIALLITSDEEGVAADGTKRVIEELIRRNEKMDYCLVGEASSEKIFGDTIKIGRRGSLSGELIIKGKQGHIAYPKLADNPIHKCFAALKEIIDVKWDEGNEHFQPTSLQFSNIQSGTGANNVIPGSLKAQFNLRYAPVTKAEKIQNTIEKILDDHSIQHEIKWHASGDPFYTLPGIMIDTLVQAIQDVTGITPTLSTAGGTSDGRFIAKTGCQVVEFGPINTSIHQIDEHIAIEDIDRLTAVYLRTLEQLLT